VAASGTATVPHVQTVLDQRDELIAFAQEAQRMAPAALQDAFRERFGRPRWPASS
jgi:hypothetical protein